MSKYTKEILEPIVKNVFTVSDVCRQLGLEPVGGNLGHIKRVINKYNIDISHFTGSAGSNRGKISNKRKSASDFLIKSNKRLKRRELKRSLLETGRTYICEGCSCSAEYNNKPITLQIDHINGDRTDHRESNLRFLCPNCHSQTPTFSGRNIVNKLK